MAQNKKSFILYADIQEVVKHLPNEKAGELFKLILAYVNDENPQTDDMVLNIAFSPIKQQLKRDLKKWESKTDQRSAAGVNSAFKRFKKRITDNIDSVDLIFEENYCKKQIQGNGNKEYWSKCLEFLKNQTNQQKEEWLKFNSTKSTTVETVTTKSTVNDNVNVTVNVNDSVNVNDNVINKKKSKIFMSKVKLSDVSEKNKDYFDIGNAFFELIKNNLTEIDAPTGHLEKAGAEKWLDQIRLMQVSDKVNIEQFKVVFNYLKKPESQCWWKSRVQSVNSLRTNFTKIYSSAKNNGAKKERNTSGEKTNVSTEYVKSVLRDLQP